MSNKKEKIINPRFKNIHTFSDLVNTMVLGLEKEWVKVDMSTFGSVRKKQFIGIPFPGTKICIGCAATNALCELMQEPFNAANIKFDERANKFNYNIRSSQLKDLELFFDHLRTGDIYDGLDFLRQISNLFYFDILNDKEYIPPFTLPRLTNNNYKSELSTYRDYVIWLRKKNL